VNPAGRLAQLRNVPAGTICRRAFRRQNVKDARGLTCDSAASCDSDRRIHTSKSHNASISHVIQPTGRGRAGQSEAGVVYAGKVP
jgi:hypothetical protein